MVPLDRLGQGDGGDGKFGPDGNDPRSLDIQVQPCDVTIANQKIKYRRRIQTMQTKVTAHETKMQIPHLPEWTGQWVANNTKPFSNVNKIKVSSHSEITSVIEEGMRQTQAWQQAWEKEKMTRQQQLQIDTSETHKWSLVGIGSTLMVVILVVFIICWCVLKQRTTIMGTIMGISRIGEIATSPPPNPQQ